MTAEAGGSRTVGEVVDAAGAWLAKGRRDARVERLAPPESSGPGDAVVVLRSRPSSELARRPVALLIVARGVEAASGLAAEAVALVDDPRWALAAASSLWAPARPEPSRHPSAVVDPSSRVDPSAHIGPCAVVGPRATIGPRAVLGPGAHVGADASIGADAVLRDHAIVMERCAVGARCLLQPGAVVGADGFGFASRSATDHRRIVQLGNVVLEDDVELGANACVDRATLGTTRLGRGTKVDNLVQVGHNVKIGPGTLLIAQSGIAGSSRLGAGVIVAAQAGIAGHLRVGDGARVYGQAGVRKDVPPGGEVAGSPAEPKTRHFRRWAVRKKLDDLFERLRAVESALQEMTRK